MYGNSKFGFPDNKSEAATCKVGGRDGDRIIINVGGHRHETHLSTLRNFPDTRLSWMVESPLTKACNSSDDGSPTEYFFDRHPGVFVHVLNYYRTGKLHCPSDVCGPLFEEELNFWGIDELQMEPCCWSTYTRHRDAQAFEKVFSVNNTTHQEDEISEGEPSGIGSNYKKSMWYGTYREKLWGMLEKPYSSKSAQVLALVSLVVIITSVVTFCLESIPALANYKKTFQILDYIYCAVFTLDFIARVSSCPDFGDFFRSTLTWCDIMSVLPFYSDMIWTVDYLNVVLVVRLFRIFRLFRFFRFMSGMQVIGHTLRASARELILLVLILLIPMVIFSSLLFYIEKAFGGDERFESIPDSFWWAVITMTTVGYGDMYPRTTLGKFIGTMCACSGVLIVALPVSVIGSNFSLFYSHAQAQLKLPRKRKQPVLVGAASALMSTVEPELGSESGSDSDSACDSASERKYKSDSKCLLNRAESAKEVQVEVESVELRRKMTPDARPPWYHNKYKSDGMNISRSLESRHGGAFSCGSPEMGLEKGLRAMGDIMLNIAAPMQRRMAISGVSLANSPSLRRSNSGKRRSRSKSGDSLRKRTNTTGSDNYKIEGFDDTVQYKEEMPVESNVENDTCSNNTVSLNRSSSSTSDGYQATNVGIDETMKSKEEQKSLCGLKENSDHLIESKNFDDKNYNSSPETHALLQKTPRDTTCRTENRQLNKKHSESMKNSENFIVETNDEKDDDGHSSRTLTTQFEDTPRVLDYNKLSPWYTKASEGEKGSPTFTRFGRRRSATINICNV